MGGGIMKFISCGTYNTTLKDFCENNKDKKIFIHKDSLPVVRVAVLEKRPIVLKYPKNMEEELNKLDYFEFVGYSRLDNISPIYKLTSTNNNIILPPNGEVISVLKDWC